MTESLILIYTRLLRVDGTCLKSEVRHIQCMRDRTAWNKLAAQCTTLKEVAIHASPHGALSETNDELDWSTLGILFRNNPDIRRLFLK